MVNQPDVARAGRTFTGFGFGAIQAGLFLVEAAASGNFSRLVVAEVVPELVAAVRKNRGRVWVNIAGENGIEPVEIGPVEIYNPLEAADRPPLIEAIAGADDLATALPSVNIYTAGDAPGGLRWLLAAGLREKMATAGPPALLYTAENNNHAAELLQAALEPLFPDAFPPNVQLLNTVIGKMSGVITAPEIMARLKLAPFTPGIARAFLVERFNHILVSRVTLPAFQRGITVFEEKEHLLPFEEAKLYGHNAAHALAAYLAAAMGLAYVARLRDHPHVLDFIRAAFLEESGAALIRKYSGQDPLFSDAGFTAYVDDLLARMTNPHLNDTVERVGRDPGRKLGWNDRLIGTMRLALAHGIEPRRYAYGAALAAAMLAGRPGTALSEAELAHYLRPLWTPDNPAPPAQAAMLRLIATQAATDPLKLTGRGTPD
jgi:mannitol-1-phosphate 5-dehydrogenase